MKYLIHPLQNSKGYALLSVLGVIVIITLLIAAMVVVSNRGLQQAAGFKVETGAKNYAEAGLENAKAILNATLSGSSGIQQDIIGPDNSCCTNFSPPPAPSGNYGISLLNGNAAVAWAKYPNAGNTLDTEYDSEFNENLQALTAWDASAAAQGNYVGGYVQALENNVNPNVQTLVVAESIGNNQIRVRSFVYDPVTKTRKGVEATYSASSSMPVGAVAQLGMDSYHNASVNRTSAAFKNNLIINDNNSMVNLGPLNSATGLPMPIIVGGELNIGNGSSTTSCSTCGVTDQNFASQTGIKFRIRDANNNVANLPTAAMSVASDYPFSVFKGRQSMICQGAGDGTTAGIRNAVYTTLHQLQDQLFSLFPYDKLKIVALNDPERITWIVNNVLTFDDDAVTIGGVIPGGGGHHHGGGATPIAKIVIFSNDPAVGFGQYTGLDGRPYQFNRMVDASATGGFTNPTDLYNNLKGSLGNGFAEADLNNLGITSANIAANKVIIRRWEGKVFPADVLFHGGYGFFATHNTDPTVNNVNPTTVTTQYTESVTGNNRTCQVLRQRQNAGGTSIDRNTLGLPGVPLAGVVYVEMSPIDMEHDPHGNFWWLKNNGGTIINLFSTDNNNLLQEDGVDIKQLLFDDFSSTSSNSKSVNIRGTLMMVFNEIGYARLVNKIHGTASSYNVTTRDEVSGRNASSIPFTAAEIQSVMDLDNSAISASQSNHRYNPFGQPRGYKYTRPPYYTSAGAVNNSVIDAWNKLTYSVDGTKTAWINARVNINRYIKPTTPSCTTACPGTGTTSGFGKNDPDPAVPPGPGNWYQSLQEGEYPYLTPSNVVSYDMDGDGQVRNEADLSNRIRLANLKSYLLNATDEWFNIDSDDFVRRPETFDASQLGTLPAVLYNTGIIDIHSVLNWSGLVYTPSRLELGAHTSPGTDVTQKIDSVSYGQIYFGSVVSGAGAAIGYNTSENGYYIEFDPRTLQGLKLENYTSLARQSWHEIPGL